MDPNSTKEIMQMIRSLSASTSDSVKSFSFGQWTPSPTKIPANNILRSITRNKPVTEAKGYSDAYSFFIWFFIIIAIISFITIYFKKSSEEKRTQELKQQQEREGQALEQEKRLEELRKQNELKEIRRKEVLAKIAEEHRNIKELEEKKRKEALVKHGYNNGYEYERYVATRLELDGWTHVTITSKSGDFGADIIGTNPNGTKCAIQCKMVQGAVGYRAVQEVISGREYYHCSHAIVITTSTFTHQAIDGAKRTGVQLISNYR